MKKSFDVYITATVSKYIGTVECETVEEFQEKSQELWEGQHYDTPSFCHQCSVDITDWDIDDQEVVQELGDEKEE